MSMLSVYLDESGHQSGDHVAVAGFVGTNEQWARFDADWLATLKGTASFHAKSLRWNRESTRRRVSILSAIPYRHGLRSIVGSVHVPDYADLLHNKAEEYVNQGYILSLYPILSAISFNVPETQPVKWIFEEQHDYEQGARDVFQQFAVLHGAVRFSDVSFVPATSTPRLQPADLLAYAILQRARDPRSPKALWSRPIIGEDPWGSIVPREIVRAVLEPSLALMNRVQQAQTGVDHREIFKKYLGKRDVHEAIRIEKEKRAAEKSKTRA
jgi:Protein of unknown function (DUF3800)